MPRFVNSTKFNPILNILAQSGSSKMSTKNLLEQLQLEFDSGSSVRSIQRYLIELEQNGFVKRTHTASVPIFEITSKGKLLLTPLEILRLITYFR